MKKYKFLERVKIALHILFNNTKDLDLIYEEGKNEIYSDYKLIKDKLEPFIDRLFDKSWKYDKLIQIPGVGQQDLYRFQFIDNPIGLYDSPLDKIIVNTSIYKSNRIEVPMKETAYFARNISRMERLASQKLTQFLLDNGFIKYRVVENLGDKCPTIVFYINVMNKQI